MQGTAGGGSKESEERTQVLKRAVKAAAAHGTPGMHVAATLALCDALRAQHGRLSPRPADPRPHLLQLLQLLTEAEGRLLGSLRLCAPADAPRRAMHPLCAEHARLLVHLARAHAEHACADLLFAERDLQDRRPAFPTFSRPASSEADRPAGRQAAPLEQQTSSSTSQACTGPTEPEAADDVMTEAVAAVETLAGKHGNDSMAGGSGGTATGAEATRTASPPAACRAATPLEVGKLHASAGVVPEEVPHTGDTLEKHDAGHRDSAPHQGGRLQGSNPGAGQGREGHTEEGTTLDVTVVERFLDATAHAAQEERGEGAVVDAPHAFHAARHACAALALCDRGAVAVDGRLAHARARLAEVQMQELLGLRVAGMGGVLRTHGESDSDSSAGDDGAGGVDAALHGGGACMLAAGLPEDVAGGCSSGVDGLSGGAAAGVRRGAGKIPAAGVGPTIEAEVAPLLRAALAAAVRLRDWPRATEVALELLRVLRLRLHLEEGATVVGECGPKGAQEVGGVPLESGGVEDVQRPGGALEGGAGTGAGAGGGGAGAGMEAEWRREVAEVAVVWQACAALREDSDALCMLATLRHQARVQHRVAEWWSRPEDSERHAWCAELEAAALPYAGPPLPGDDAGAEVADGMDRAGEGRAEAAEERHTIGRAARAPLDSRGFAGQLAALKRSNWVHGRVAAMLCEPVADAVSVQPLGVALLVLAIEAPASGRRDLGAEAVVHAVSVRQVAAGEGGMDMVHCMGSIDTGALDALCERLGAWEVRMREGQCHGGGEASSGEDVRVADVCEGVRAGDALSPDAKDGWGNVASEEVAGAGAEGPSGSAVAIEWAGIVERMDALLGPVRAAITAAAAAVEAPPPPEPPKGKKGGAPSEPPPPLQPAVVVCACRRLAALPLEALPGLAAVAAVARERSVQHAAARWQLAVSPGTTGGAGVAVVDVSKAAFSVSRELQEVVAAQLAEVPTGEWQENAYRPEWLVSQGYHLMMAKECQASLHWTCKGYSTHVHDETVAGLELQKGAFAAVLDHLGAPQRGPAHADQAVDEAGEAKAEAPLVAAGCTVRRDAARGGGHGSTGLHGPEGRMRMLLQRGASCCVSNRWALSAVDALNMAAAVLPPHGTAGVGVAVRRAAGEVAAARCAPWLQSCLVVHGLPGLVLEAAKATDAGQGKKKKK